MTLGDCEQEFPEVTGGLGNSVSEGGSSRMGRSGGSHTAPPLYGARSGSLALSASPDLHRRGFPAGSRPRPAGSGRSSTVRRGAGGVWVEGRNLPAGRGGAEFGPRGSAPGRGPAAIRSCVPPFRPRVLPAAPTFRPSPAGGGPPPCSFLARPQRRPSPQCPATTGTWACRWRRARKARRMASGKQVIQGAAGTAFAFPGVPSWERAPVGDGALKGQKSPPHPALGESRTTGAGSEVQGEHRERIPGNRSIGGTVGNQPRFTDGETEAT